LIAQTGSDDRVNVSSFLLLAQAASRKIRTMIRRDNGLPPHNGVDGCNENSAGADENHDAGDKTDHHEEAGGRILPGAREAIAPMSIVTISRIRLAQI
jgi:hypothetical protein